MLNKDEVDGKLDQAKGRVKQAVGALTGDKHLKVEGRVDEATGKVEETIGHLRRKVDDAADELGAAVKK